MKRISRRGHGIERSLSRQEGLCMIAPCSASIIPALAQINGRRFHIRDERSSAIACPEGSREDALLQFEGWRKSVCGIDAQEAKGLPAEIEAEAFVIDARILHDEIGAARCDDERERLEVEGSDEIRGDEATASGIIGRRESRAGGLRDEEAPEISVHPIRARSASANGEARHGAQGPGRRIAGDKRELRRVRAPFEEGAARVHAAGEIVRFAKGVRRSRSGDGHAIDSEINASVIVDLQEIAGSAVIELEDGARRVGISPQEGKAFKGVLSFSRQSIVPI